VTSDPAPCRPGQDAGDTSLTLDLRRRAQRLDARLLALPARWRRLILGVTIGTMIGVGIPHVPRPFADYSSTPILRDIDQALTYGPDTVSDMYGAKVTLNNPRDMYTKREVDQTPLEAATWSKEQSAPYPPVALLSTAALYALGEASGIGYYGLILGLACLFLGVSLLYFLRTRWYLFPLLYLNFSYLGWRFVYVQDGTYLMMLVVILIALCLARAGYGAGVVHSLIALAITMKLSPLYYAKSLFGMHAWSAASFIGIVGAGLVLPFFVFENYAYIFSYQNDLRGGHWSNLVGPFAVVVPFSLVLWYVETRLDFDREDRIGWGLVPFAMLLSMKMNTARHLLMVLLIPDKRGARNIAAAVGLGLHALLPSVVLFGSVVYITSGLLVVALVYYLHEIGWSTIREDLRRPGRVARLMLAKG
jgi:hypothetical protein